MKTAKQIEQEFNDRNKIIDYNESLFLDQEELSIYDDGEL